MLLLVTFATISYKHRCQIPAKEDTYCIL